MSGRYQPFRQPFRRCLGGISLSWRFQPLSERFGANLGVIDPFPSACNGVRISPGLLQEEYSQVRQLSCRRRHNGASVWPQLSSTSYQTAELSQVLSLAVVPTHDGCGKFSAAIGDMAMA
jgi:hypothetical protein